MWIPVPPSATLALAGAIIFCCLRYRDTVPASRTLHGGSANWLEVTWTSATFLAFVVIFAWSAHAYFERVTPPADAAEIHVVAKQWMWKTQHANGRREVNELHLLVNQPVKLLMTSQDVIHDFFVPDFRTKQDVLPGRYTTQWFTPTRPGRYHLYCAEYCGMDHSQMGGWIHVLAPADYARWLADESAGESVLAAGQRLYVSLGCSGCHAPNAVVRAPLLNGLYGRPVALADGTTVVADEQYLRDSILLPNKQISAGYPPVMPTYQGQLTEDEVMQLVAYLKSLRSDAP